MRIIHVTNPSAMDLPAMREFIDEAREHVPETPPTDDVLDWLRKNVEDPKIGFYVATEGGVRFQGCALVNYYTDLWSPQPWVIAVYSRRPEARRLLGDCMHAELRDRGFDRCRLIDQSGVSERAFRHLWRHWATARKVGPLFEMTLLEL